MIYAALLGLGFLPIAAVFVGIRKAALAYLVLVPLYMYHKSMFVTTSLGGFSLQIPTLVKDLVATTLLLVSVAVVALRYHAIIPDRAVRHFKAAGALTLVGVLLMIIGLVRGQSVGQVVIGARPYVFYQVVGLVLGYFVLSRPGGWDRVVKVLMWGCGFIAFVALVQQYIYPYFLITSTLRRVYLGNIYPWSVAQRESAFFTSANVLGYFAAFGLILCVWHVMFRRDGVWNLSYGVFAAAQVWVLLLTLSRSAFIGAAIGIAMLVRAHHRRTGKGAFWVLFGVAGVAWLVLVSPLSSRFAESVNNPRLTIWDAAVRHTLTSLSSIVFGEGLGSIGRLGAEVGGTLNLGSAVNSSIGSDVGFVDNAAVQAFYEIGVVGLGLLVWTAVLCWRQIRVARSSTAGDAAGLAAVMVYVLAISIFSPSLYTYPWSFLFWVAAAGSYLGLADRSSVASRDGIVSPAASLSPARIADPSPHGSAGIASPVRGLSSPNADHTSSSGETPAASTRHRASPMLGR